MYMSIHMAREREKVTQYQYHGIYSSQILSNIITKHKKLKEPHLSTTLIIFYFSTKIHMILWYVTIIKIKKKSKQTINIIIPNI